MKKENRLEIQNLRKRNRRIKLIACAIGVVITAFCVPDVLAKYVFRTILELPGFSVRKETTVEIPTGKTLVYAGIEAEQEGVEGGENYILSGTYRATIPGHYKATAKLKDSIHMKWSDGTKEPKEIDWTINICRIREEYYVTLNEAFETNESTKENPIIYLHSYEEEAVNSDGEDYLNLNGCRMAGENIPITNRGTLTIYNGELSCIGKNSGEHTGIKNYGVLTASDIAVNTDCGENEVALNGIYNLGGTVTLTDFTSIQKGKNAIPVGINMEGGYLTGENITLQSYGEAKNHGTYGIWMEDGQAEVKNIFVELENLKSYTYLCCGVKGEILIQGGELFAQGHDGIASVAATQGTLSFLIDDLKATLETNAESSLFSALDQSDITINGGDYEIRYFGDAQVTNGFLAYGEITVNGGTFSFSGDQKSIVCAAVPEKAKNGKIFLNGGEISARTDNNIIGLYANAGEISVDGARFQLQSLNGLSLGSLQGFEDSAIELLSGEFTLYGNTVSTVRGYEFNYTEIPRPEAIPFEIYYKDGYDNGYYQTNAPYIQSAEVWAMKMLMKKSAGTKKIGEFSSGQVLYERRISENGSVTDWVLPIGTKESKWEVQETKTAYWIVRSQYAESEQETVEEEKEIEKCVWAIAGTQVREKNFGLANAMPIYEYELPELNIQTIGVVLPIPGKTKLIYYRRGEELLKIEIRKSP